MSFKRVSYGTTDFTSNNRHGGRNLNGQPESKVRPRSQWSRSHQRKVCDHDVRALAVCGQKLFSGGKNARTETSFILSAEKEKKKKINYCVFD